MLKDKVKPLEKGPEWISSFRSILWLRRDDGSDWYGTEKR